MVRKTQSGKSPNKKSRRSDPDSSDRHLTFTETNVHKRNLCIVSFPFIFLFNILQTILYQIFIICRFVYYSSSTFFVRNRNSIPASDAPAATVQNCVVVEEIHEMSVIRNTGPGPGDPLLAKQKHHHRRAFEYISKALKIDEENEGWVTM